jgi:hypothetical protein
LNIGRPWKLEEYDCDYRIQHGDNVTHPADCIGHFEGSVLWKVFWIAPAVDQERRGKRKCDLLEHHRDVQDGNKGLERESVHDVNRQWNDTYQLKISDTNSQSETPALR